ncbi:MAG TPA: hypothetical protein VGP68_00545 [Gemmataceae bacterium]|nr:hypothetical protein [Gemmataceae bacterium]
MNFVLLILDLIEDPKAIIGTKAKFPIRSKVDWSKQRFAVSGLDIWLVQQLILNG